MSATTETEGGQTVRGPRSRRLLIGAAAALAAAGVGAGVVGLAGWAGLAGPAGSGGGATDAAGATVVSAPVSTAWPTAVYARDQAGVVSITATGAATGFGPYGGGEQTALGSGVVIDRSGDILTNAHVVNGAGSVRVTFTNGTSATAGVVGRDESTDLAVIHVGMPAATLRPISLATDASVRVGDPVMAIGSPFGLAGSASVGIVSAVGRSIQAPDGATITDAIQTDAAINHGSSGGALLDASGRLIGITSQLADSGVDANVGVGFAISADTARQSIQQIEGNA